MAVKIRLRRMGTRGKPFYRVVVADGRAARNGRFIEVLGYFDPRTEPVTLKLDEERILLWLGRGACPSDTVEALLKKENIYGKFLAAKEKKGAEAPAVEPAAVEVEEVKAPKKTRAPKVAKEVVEEAKEEKAPARRRKTKAAAEEEQTPAEAEVVAQEEPTEEQA